MTTKYAASKKDGSKCTHVHRSIEAAERCAGKDGHAIPINEEARKEFIRLSEIEGARIDAQ